LSLVLVVIGTLIWAYGDLLFPEPPDDAEEQTAMIWCVPRINRAAHGRDGSADPFPDHVPAPSFGPRMVCTRCGIIGADPRPNWQEQPARLTGAGTAPWQ
jgi:hypothetical protein